MNACKIVSFLFLCILMIPHTGYCEVNDGYMERFLNVKQWKGSIDIRVKKSLHHKNDYTGGYSEDKFDSVRSFHIEVTTSDGMISMTDPFAAEKEPGRGGAIEKGDMFEGINFKQMQAAMKRSGLNTAMIMGQMNKMKGLHISANKYKMWENTQLANTEKLNISGRWHETDFHRSESSGEGQAGFDQSLRTTDGNYQGFGGVSLVINLQKQAYGFKWGMLERSPQTAKETFRSENSDGNGEHWTREVAFEDFTKDIWRTIKFEPLPGSGLNLAGIKTWRDTDDDGGLTEVTLQWMIVPSDQALPEPWVEFVKGGEDWLPEKDNQVEAVLRWKDSVSPSAVRFTLYDISAEPGTSLNSKDDNTDLDMEFDKTNKERRYVITKSDKSFVATKNHLADQSAQIILHAKDYGAYAKLKAEIKVNGNWFEATSKTFHLPYLPVPYDKNNNLIADKWEKDVGVLGKNLSLDWDEDPEPSAQHSNGDGFTLYEEYRGFRETAHVFRKGVHEQVKDGHVRMDPMYKDVFIYDKDGLFMKYYKDYNPADLNWHTISVDMIKKEGSLNNNPDYRWVNYNTSGEFSNQHQYAIFIRNMGTNPDPKNVSDSGFNMPIPACDTKDPYFSYTNPLKCFYTCAIYLTHIRKWADTGPKKRRAGLNSEQTTTTVIHELGHAIGIRHHNNPLSNKSDDRWEGDGVRDCAMRYDKELGPNDNWTKTRYCKTGEVYTSWPKNGGKQYTSHNCYGLINIKGD